MINLNNMTDRILYQMFKVIKNICYETWRED